MLVLAAALCVACAAPAPKPGVVAAPLAYSVHPAPLVAAAPAVAAVAPVAPVATAYSSQVVARNYNTLVAAPAAPLLAAPGAIPVAYSAYPAYAGYPASYVL